MKKRKRLLGTVKKVIKPVLAHEPEKVEIKIHEADELYQEIRIENAVTDENGKAERLKQGENVDIVVEADPGSEEPQP
jgi:hypothetical protein